jgi:hypothetical protein
MRYLVEYLNGQKFPVEVEGQPGTQIDWLAIRKKARDLSHNHTGSIRIYDQDGIDLLWCRDKESGVELDVRQSTHLLTNIANAASNARVDLATAGNIQAFLVWLTAIQNDVKRLADALGTSLLPRERS